MERSDAATTTLELPAPRWSTGWREFTPLQKFGPIVGVALYSLILWSLNGFRNDHLWTCIGVLILYYAGSRGRTFLAFGMPLLLTGVVYDSMRFYSDFIRAEVRVAEPYLFDKTYFGITTALGVLTPNEWFQLHTHPALDLITGFFYLTFIGIFILIAAHFRFKLSRTGSPTATPLEAKKTSLRMMWTFFWVNAIGYTTYYWYPAAPPWYVALKGLGPADMTTQPNPAGCIRFDQLLGTHFFTEMYGRSADVFGAIPSLHVAYPLLAAIYSFQLKSLRAFSTGFFLIMCFSAVYLNHHYIIDILAGSAYAVLIYFLVEWVSKRRQKHA